MWTIDQFTTDYITHWEGGLSLDPKDAGNWTGGKAGVGKLVGSKYGVTSSILASYRHVANISGNDMSALTLAEAVRIAEKLFYTDPGLANLAWNHVSASIMDFGWTAGPHHAIVETQKMVGAAPDGHISPGGETVRKFAAFCAAEQGASKIWCAQRVNYYENVVASNPNDAKYLNGWTNRSDYFLPGTPWWSKFGA